MKNICLFGRKSKSWGTVIKSLSQVEITYMNHLAIVLEKGLLPLDTWSNWNFWLNVTLLVIVVLTGRFLWHIIFYQVKQMSVFWFGCLVLCVWERGRVFASHILRWSTMTVAHYLTFTVLSSSKCSLKNLASPIAAVSIQLTVDSGIKQSSPDASKILWRLRAGHVCAMTV